MPMFVALIVAAGESRRTQNGTLKQYTQIGNRTVLAHTIMRTLAPFVHSVRVVIGHKHTELYEHTVTSLPHNTANSLLRPVYGGKRRQDSVRIGLESIEYINPDFVIIHDACRPFANIPNAETIMHHLSEHSGMVPSVQPIETVSVVERGLMLENVPRESIRTIQTPQIFRYRDILLCHRKSASLFPEKDFSDDSSLLLFCQMSVKIIDGDYNNFKITTASDISRAEFFMQNREKVPL